MQTEAPLYELLGVKQDTYNLLVEKVPQALIKAIRNEETPNAVKADAIYNLYEEAHSYIIYKDIDMRDFEMHKISALIGIMVEQAYNAALLQSQQKKPLFGKRK